MVDNYSCCKCNDKYATTFVIGDDGNIYCTDCYSEVKNEEEQEMFEYCMWHHFNKN